MLCHEIYAYKERHGTLPERLTDIPDLHPQLLRCPVRQHYGRPLAGTCSADYVYVYAGAAAMGFPDEAAPLPLESLPVVFDCPGNHPGGKVHVLIANGAVVTMKAQEFESFAAEVARASGPDSELGKQMAVFVRR